MAGRADWFPEGVSAIEKNLRCNEQIRISPVRLIDDNDQQLGIVEVREALTRAYEAGMDLVEVAPQARPPVCRIMDYGKWKYAQRKKEQKSKAQRHETELKEIRIKTPKIGDNDLRIKVQRAHGFLERGDRVQFSMRFRGRELAHVDEGRKIFEHIVAELGEVGKVDRMPRFEGRQMTISFAPTHKELAKPEGKADSPPPAPQPQPTQQQAQA